MPPSPAWESVSPVNRGPLRSVGRPPPPRRRVPPALDGGGRGWTGPVDAREESIEVGILRSLDAVCRSVGPSRAPSLGRCTRVRACVRACTVHNASRPRRDIFLPNVTVGWVQRVRGWSNTDTKQLSTVDPSARASMKNAANCDT